MHTLDIAPLRSESPPQKRTVISTRRDDEMKTKSVVCLRRHDTAKLAFESERAANFRKYAIYIGYL